MEFVKSGPFQKSSHTHGEHGSHTRVECKRIPAIDTEGRMLASDDIDFLQFICLDDGVIYKELEIKKE